MNIARSPIGYFIAAVLTNSDVFLYNPDTGNRDKILRTPIGSTVMDCYGRQGDLDRHRQSPTEVGLDAVQDIQVLSPIYRGPAGVIALNDRLQENLNPPAKDKPECHLFGTVFRQGDKVMQTQNNYDKDVYNADIGFIQAMDFIEQTLTVNFDGQLVFFEWSEADQLTLAYVVSVHKAKGSEFPAVVMSVVTQHYIVLQRNLLYTAITRARSLCVLAGSRKAVGMAIRNDKVANRFTALEWRLGRCE